MAQPALFRFSIYPADTLRAQTGANFGDAIGVGDDAIAGDTYRMAGEARAIRLAISDTDAGGPCVADGSEIGAAGTPITIKACHLLMSPTGEMVEILMLQLQEATGTPAPFLLPLAPIAALTEYELLGTEIDSAPDRFEDIASVSFLAGTHLTRSDGMQVKVEDLKPGDEVLTRDHGPSTIRAVTHQTRRATGPAALVRISAGTLNTSRDLKLAPQHRLFLWQRRDELGTGRAEVLVKAELLVNGRTVFREDAGYVDSYQLVFDRHQIIYAEGIAVESLLVSGRGRGTEESKRSTAPVGWTPSAEFEIERSDIGEDGDVTERLSRAVRGNGD